MLKHSFTGYSAERRREAGHHFQVEFYDRHNQRDGVSTQRSSALSRQSEKLKLCRRQALDRQGSVLVFAVYPI